jgi:hypothetical protein
VFIESEGWLALSGEINNAAAVLAANNYLIDIQYR